MRYVAVAFDYREGGQVFVTVYGGFESRTEADAWIRETQGNLPRRSTVHLMSFPVTSKDPERRRGQLAGG